MFFSVVTIHVLLYMFHTFSGILRSLEQGTISCNMHISHIFHRFQVTCNKCTIQFNHTYILCSYMWTMHVLPYTFHTFLGILRSLEQGTISCNMHISHNFTEFRLHATSIPYSLIIHTFSVATCELCMLDCFLFHCIGTKCTGNALNISGAGCSPQVLRETNFPQVAFSFLLCPFTPDMNAFVTYFIIVCNVATHMQGF